MNHNFRIFLAALSCFSSLSFAGEQYLSDVGADYPIKLSGYVKSESYWDTRQVVGSAADEVLLYPEKIILDAQCQDINAKGQYEMIAIQTRMHADVFGPKIKNATSKGVIEFDFFGKGTLINILRVRHAYIQLNWEKVSIIGGQYWHPFYTLDAFARTISNNSGSPMVAFSRNPQFRLTWSPRSSLDLIFCALSELDFQTNGPIGFSTSYMRNAVVPMLDFQLQGHLGEHNIGVGIDYKRIVPRLKTDTGLKARESLNSAGAIAYAALNWPSVSIWNKMIFIQNATNQTMIGGYGIHAIDEVSDKRDYANINTFSWWMDVDITRSKSLIPGFFIGVTKNLGARETILPNIVDSQGNITEKRIYGMGTDIDTVFRFSPRIQWRVKNFIFATEFEYTRAAYGTIDDSGDVINTDPVANSRLLMAMFYYF